MTSSRNDFTHWSDPHVAALPAYFTMHTAPMLLQTARRGVLRRFSTTVAPRSQWKSGPAPPRLPKEEQEVFERLQQQSSGAFSTPRQIDIKADEQHTQAQQDLEAAASKTADPQNTLEQLRENSRVVAQGEGEELHPNVRRGAAPEFQGNRNPNTGEVGGPKNDPLRWGNGGDWSYNGRVTDF